MNRNQLRNSFTSEIIGRIPNTTSITLEYIRKALKQDQIFYLPNYSIKSQLINEWLGYSNSNIIVSKNNLLKNTTKLELGTMGDILNGSVLSSYIISFDQFFENSNVFENLKIFKNNFALIFEGIDNIDEMNSILEHSSVDKAILKFFITDNIILFNNYLKNPPSISCYSHNIFTKNPVYKSVLETSEIIYFEDSESYKEQLLDKATKIKHFNVELSTFLVKLDLFHSYFFTDEYFNDADAMISEKLRCLIKIIEILNGQEAFIYFNNDIDEYYVKEVLLYLSKDINCNINQNNSEYITNQIKNLLINKCINGSRFSITNRTFKYSNTPLNIHSIREVPSNTSTKIIVFNFSFIFNNCQKIFIIPESMRMHLRTIVMEDSNLFTLYQQYLNRNKPSNNYYSQNKFEVISEALDSVKNSCKGKDFINLIEKIDSKIYITAKCSIGKIPTCFNLHGITKEPIVIPRQSPNKFSLIVYGDSIEFCTITSLKTLSNSKILHSHGYFLLLDKRMIFYSFSSDRNLMIDIDADDIEDYILISNKKAPTRAGVLTTRKYKSEEDTYGYISEYSTLIQKTELQRECIVLSFCLKNRPRIYTIEPSEELAIKLCENIDISDKCQFFSALEWKRLCSDEFNDHEERFDMRISIPCYQDLPVEGIDNFFNFLKDGNDEGNRSEQFGIAQKNCMINLLVKSVSNYPGRLIATELLRNKPEISLKNILERFYEYEFEFFYSIACLISRKGRFLVSKVTRTDLEFISTQNLLKYCESLDKKLNTRFSPINFDISFDMISNSNININKNSNSVMIRTVVISPLNVLFNYETKSESNRILRTFDPDKFCRVVIREENGKDKFTSDLTKNTDGVYDYFRKIMLNGLVIGLRKYFFLVMTTSQMKIHGSWFITPYEHDNVMIGADYVKSWIGNFNKIKNIGKYASRIGLALSSTVPTYQFDDFIEIEDIEKNSYCFTDGIGLITKKHANYISSIFGLNHIPSAFQIRFGGYKGVLVVHPWLDDLKIYEEWSKDNSNIIKGFGKLSENIKTQVPDLILRKSMNKFESSNRILEIITVSKSTKFYLNRQIILVLEGLGVHPQVFIDLQDLYIQNLISQVHLDFPFFIKQHSILSLNVSSDITFYRKLQGPIISRVFEELNSKSKILIGQGRGAIGVIDELGVLEEDQIFCMFQKDVDENMENLKDYGSYFVPNCYCIVAKNPVMHPGDIRMVRCVDSPQLHYLKNVVVFSRKGTRPIFNQCSGSDLDGDIFLVSWCRALMPKATFKPYNYVDTCALVKDKVLLSDIVNFYIRHMKSYQLGQIATTYMAISDRYTIFNEKSLKLSDIFNKNIDYVKTGHFTTIPEDLIPTEYPDFMERSPSYYSTKALGHLYRRSSFDLSGINYCECSKCIAKELQELPKWKNFILQGAGIKTREIPNSETFSEEYLTIYEHYIEDIKILMDKTQTKNEEELFCYNFEDKSGVMQELKNVIFKYSELLKNKNASKILKICGCKNYNGILALCGDSYKLKNTVKRDIIRNGKSKFIFNSKISIIDGFVLINEEPKNELKDFYQNEFNDELITVNCNMDNYEKLAKSLDFKRKDIFKDMFNLIILSGLYKIDQIDQIIDLFMLINRNMKESTVAELLKVAIPGSDNTLFKILCLLPLDLSLIKKAALLREKTLLKHNENYKISKICKRFCLIISGMLDENDDIEFTNENSMIIPALKNKGECIVEYYKDTLRGFLINILYSNENLKFLQIISGEQAEAETQKRGKWQSIEDFKGKTEQENPENGDETELKKFRKNNKKATSLALYEVCFTPGIFYFTEVPETHLNDRLSVRSVERILSSKNSSENLSFAFKNIHDALDSDKRSEILTSIKKMNKLGIKETLSFIYKTIRFDIEISDGAVQRITTDKKIMGKSFIVNSKAKNDLHVELFRKKVIYDSSICLLEEDELFMIQKLILPLENDSYKILFDQKKYNCIKIKLEKNIIYANDDGFSIVYKTLYTGNDILYFKADKACCFASKEFFIENIEGFNFDKIFGKLWKIYTNIL